MSDGKKSSLDDQLKQAELERLQSEADKNRAEEALFRKQQNEVWYSGRSLRLIIGGCFIACVNDNAYARAVRSMDS